LPRQSGRTSPLHHHGARWSEVTATSRHVAFQRPSSSAGRVQSMVPKSGNRFSEKIMLSIKTLEPDSDSIRKDKISSGRIWLDEAIVTDAPSPFAQRGSIEQIEEGTAFAPKFDRDGLI